MSQNLYEHLPKALAVWESRGQVTHRGFRARSLTRMTTRPGPNRYRREGLAEQGAGLHAMILKTVAMHRTGGGPNRIDKPATPTSAGRLEAISFVCGHGVSLLVK